MVFLLADWGMGDSDAQLTRANHHQALRLHQENRVEDDAEVALHPLANQVGFFFLLLYICTFYKTFFLFSQVGGHTRLLLLNQSTICKPLNYREFDFYQNLPRDIDVFVPKYKGVMQATHASGTKWEKRYSPSFRDEAAAAVAAASTTGRAKLNGSKRRREEVLR